MSKYHPQTQLIHEGLERSPFGETAEALYLTSGFTYDNAEQAEARFKQEETGFLYSRFGNPTVRAFEERMIVLEGDGAQDARATATGMAAVTTALFSLVKTGDHVVAAQALFSSCRYVVETLLPRFGVECTLVDGRELSEWKSAMRPNTKVLFLETPSNPLLEICDMQAIAHLAHENDAKLVVDNVFATPILQKPFAFGADVVVYSATKHIDGQGRCLGGVILGAADFIADDVGQFIRQTGPSLSPFNAWVMLKALETLSLRVQAHCDNAEAIVEFLATHKQVERIYYPHDASHPQHNLAMAQMSRGGSLIAFDVKGDKQKTFAIANALRLILISNNLGDAKSLITHPATTTHSKLSQEARDALSIKNGTLRLSVGLEHGDDIIADLDQALNG